MKERPILFNAEMVRAVMDERKTQTRRVIKPQPVIPEGFNECHWSTSLLLSTTTKEGVKTEFNPPIKDSDIWCATTENIKDSYVRKGIGQVFWTCPYGKVDDRLTVVDTDIKLEITDVRVERLQDISEDDAIDEGADMPLLSPEDGGLSETRRRIREIAFPVLWNSIYNTDPVKGWDANPWVWVIEFKRVEVKS